MKFLQYSSHAKATADKLTDGTPLTNLERIVDDIAEDGPETSRHPVTFSIVASVLVSVAVAASFVRLGALLASMR